MLGHGCMCALLLLLEGTYWLLFPLITHSVNIGLNPFGHFELLLIAAKGIKTYCLPSTSALCENANDNPRTSPRFHDRLPRIAKLSAELNAILYTEISARCRILP